MAVRLSVHPDNPQGRHIKRAAEVLSRGGVVVYPTDTVYGLGCDITNKKAIEKITAIKGRDPKKPMSFVCSDLQHISRYALVSNFAYRILKRFLPGPYTFVLEATRETPKILLTKQKTVGIRIPDNKVSLELVSALGNPIISTSANLSNDEPIGNPDDLAKILGPRVDIILDSGVLAQTPSTVVSLVGDNVDIIREGAGMADYFKELMES
ncbi:MAG: threonylcarbamoyl-AMP synthase [Deltaproteobacteria bacterium]|nr:MAG: threonylcarbamoyl-AMP synthase [Deltaproteobacteria bacterium]